MLEFHEIGNLYIQGVFLRVRKLPGVFVSLLLETWHILFYCRPNNFGLRPLMQDMFTLNLNTYN